MDLYKDVFWELALNEIGPNAICTLAMFCIVFWLLPVFLPGYWIFNLGLKYVNKCNQYNGGGNKTININFKNKCIVTKLFQIEGGEGG